MKTCCAVRVVLNPGLQHDAAQAVPGHVDVAVQALLVRLAQAVVHGAGDLDRVGEVAKPAGGDPRPQTDSRQLPLDLGDQRRVLLSRNLWKFSLLFF